MPGVPRRIEAGEQIDLAGLCSVRAKALRFDAVG
jgi:hypothetical protein